MLIARFCTRTWFWTGLLAVAAGAALLPPGLAKATTAGPTAPAGYSISLFASAPTGDSSPDDICRLDGHVFVGYQDGVGPNGEPNGNVSTSTVVEYNDDGSIANQWSVSGKVDGLGADPADHRVIATANEDSNSSLFTITPSAPPSAQLVHYLYSPSPSPSSGSGPLLTGGGTDSVTVLPSGTILVAASNPQSLGAAPQTIVGGSLTATFRVTLTPPGGGSTTGTATLSPTFLDDSQATLAPSDTSSGALNLSDPDSNAYVPFSSPLYGNQFVQISQGDHQLVFSGDIGSPSAPYNAGDLTVLNMAEKTGPTTVSAGIDDVRWVDGDGGTFYVVDAAGGVGGHGAIYAITGPFFPGEVLASVSETGAPNSSAVVSDGQTVDTLNLTTGILTPFATGFVKAAGEVWVPAGGGDNAGAQGPSGPTGATGPRGPAGHSELVICIRFFRTTTCTRQSISGAPIRVDAGGEHATLTRNGKRYATGIASTHNGRDVLSLRAARVVPRGRFRLTIERTQGAVTTDTTRAITIR